MFPKVFTWELVNLTFKNADLLLRFQVAVFEEVSMILYY